MLGETRHGFVAPGRDPSRPLVVDPVLDWSTFYVGSGSDHCGRIAVLDENRVVVCGATAEPLGDGIDVMMATAALLAFSTIASGGDDPETATTRDSVIAESVERLVALQEHGSS